MEYPQSHDPADEPKVSQMLRVDPRHPIDLKGVIVMCGILEEPIRWIEDLVGNQEEPFPGGKLSSGSEICHLSYLDTPP